VRHPTLRNLGTWQVRCRGGYFKRIFPSTHTGADEPMGSIVAENRKSLMLFSGQGFPELAEEIGQVLGVAPTPSDNYEFANGEIFVRFKDSVRGSDAFVVQSVTEGVNRWVMETLIMIDALKRGSAKRITVVLPFYPYSRQDK
jgi:ribose-phosphate pyrophosphokinase